MHAMVTQMAGPWETFRQNLSNLQDRLFVALENVFDRAITLGMSSSPFLAISAIDLLMMMEISADPNGIPTGSLRTLSITLRHRQALVLSSVKKLCEDFESDMS